MVLDIFVRSNFLLTQAQTEDIIKILPNLKQDDLPDWVRLMNPVEKPDRITNCWAYATASVVEAAVHKLIGKKIGIKFNIEQLTCFGCIDCEKGCNAFNAFGLKYIYQNKIRSPQGINSFPN